MNPQPSPLVAMDPGWRSAERWTRLRNECAAAKRQEAAADGVALCEATMNWLTSGSPRPDTNLAARAFSHNSTVIGPAASMALAIIAADLPNTSELVFSVFKNAPASSRAQMLRFLPYPKVLPESLLCDLARTGLTDRSGLARVFAGELACNYRFVDLIPVMQRQLHIERSSKWRKSLGFELSLLSKGYFASQHTDSWSLSFPAQKGTGGVCGVSVPAAVVETLGVEEVARMYLQGSVPENWGQYLKSLK